MLIVGQKVQVPLKFFCTGEPQDAQDDAPGTAGTAGYGSTGSTAPHLQKLKKVELGQKTGESATPPPKKSRDESSITVRLAKLS